MRGKTAEDRALLELLDPVAEAAGYEIVRARLMSGAARRLQVMAERPDGEMDVSDCARLSRAIADVLEASQAIDGDYGLEVSSPGIDRPLTRLKDFVTFDGCEARIELDRLAEGRKRFSGVLAGVEDEAVGLDLEGEEETLFIPFAWIADAKLVLTDDLIARGAAARAARQAQTEPDPDFPSKRDIPMAIGIAANRQELLQIVDAVAREKAIEKELVIEAIEEAFQKGAKARYGAEHDIRVHIDPRTGETTIKRVITVIADDATFEGVDENGDVVEAEPPPGSRRLSEAKRTDPSAVVGKTYEEILPPFEFGRVQTQMARQVVTGKVREAERERQYEEFKDRVGEIVNGSVKRVEYGNTIVDLGRGEGIMRRDQSIPREQFNIGDRIRCYIYDVRRENKGPQIMLSRAHGGFMAKLFAQEVPEVYDGVIEIRAVARDPGSRAKMAVISNESSIDPVGACVGMRGSRVQAVVAELQGEKIDIIQWNADEPTFIVNALAPAEVSKVVLDEEDERVEVVVPDEQLSLAIGRRGQNVRLASQLTNWQIDIITESQESERRQREFAERTALFQEALDVDEVIAQLLVTEGFAAVEDIAYVDNYEIASIEGFDEETAEEIQARARDFLDRIAAEQDAKRRELGVEDGVLEIEGVTLPMAVALGEADIKTVEDLAGSVPDDLRGWFETKGGERVREPGALEAFNLSPEDAEALIMRARIAMGWVEAPEEPAYEEGDYDGEEGAEAAEGAEEPTVEAGEEPAEEA